MKCNCDVAFEMLADYVEGRIDGEARVKLESHLADKCPQCQPALSWLSRTINLMRADTSVTPPRAVMDRAIRLFREHYAKPKRAVANLFFDSLLGASFQMSPVGVRSSGTMTRQVLYGTEELDVDMLIEEAEAFELALGLPRQSRMNLMGQVLRRGDEEGRVLNYEIAIMRGHECVFSGRTNSLGEFTVDNLCSDSYELHVSGEDGGLVIKELDLRANKA